MPVLYKGFWVLSHDAIYVNSNMPYANLFGHVHNSPIVKDFSSQHFCVSVERINYRPISFDEIVQKVKEKAMIDLHIHTKYSDGTDTSEELIKKLKTKSISVFSVTDHDTVDFYDNIDRESLNGLRLITGVEFSCRTTARKCHILGYGFDTNNKCIRDLILKGQELRKSKLIKRLEYLEKECGIAFEKSDKNYLLSMKAAGKPHIAQLVVKMGFAKTISEAIEKYMKKMPGGNDKLDAKEAISAIKAAGGIPVWAHPLGGEGEKHLSKDEFENQFDLLKGFGIQGLECFYSRYNKEEIDFLCNVADSNGLCKSAGSDYHGSVKNIEIGTLSCEMYNVDIKKVTVLKFLSLR